MSDEPDADAIADEEVDVAATATAYAAEVAGFVEKYRQRAIAEVHGDRFREAVPTPRAAGGDAPDDDDRPPRVLDVGCGPGVDAAVFAESGLAVVGVDVTPPFLQEARDAVPRAEFVGGDMRSLPLAGEAVEGVWSCASFLHVPRADAADTLAEFARVLRPGGALFVSVMASEPRDADAVELADGRRFTFWPEGPLLAAVRAAGFAVEWTADEAGWHTLVAVRE